MKALKIKIAYSLKFYVRDLYAKNADKRGGKTIEYPKKNKRAFKDYLSLSIIDTESVLKNIKYPFSEN